jgi:hypothetical protein
MSIKYINIFQSEILKNFWLQPCYEYVAKWLIFSPPCLHVRSRFFWPFRACTSFSNGPMTFQKYKKLSRQQKAKTFEKVFLIATFKIVFFQMATFKKVFFQMTMHFWRSRWALFFPPPISIAFSKAQLSMLHFRVSFSNVTFRTTGGIRSYDP